MISYKDVFLTKRITLLVIISYTITNKEVIPLLNISIVKYIYIKMAYNIIFYKIIVPYWFRKSNVEKGKSNIIPLSSI